VFGVKYNTGMLGGGCIVPSTTEPTQEDAVAIPSLDAGRSLDFYAVNQSNHCAWLIPPDSVTVKMDGDEKETTVRLVADDKASLFTGKSPVFSPTAIKWAGLVTHPGGPTLVRTNSMSCERSHPELKPPMPHIHITRIEFSAPDAALGKAESRVNFVNNGETGTEIVSWGRMAWYIEQPTLDDRWRFEASLLHDEPLAANRPFGFHVPSKSERDITLTSSPWEQSALDAFRSDKASVYSVGIIFYKFGKYACQSTYCMYAKKDGRPKSCLLHNDEPRCGE
jgi:hypothetical protein